MTRPHTFSVCFHAPLRWSVVADRSRELPPLPLSPPSPIAPESPPSPEIQARAESQAFDQVIVSLQAAAGRCEAQYELMLGEMQQAAVELALAVASRVLMSKVEAGDFPLEPLIRHIVGRLPVKGEINVHLHPEDLALLQKRLGDRTLVQGGPTIQFHANPASARGECRATTGGVTIVSDLMDQLANLREHLLESIL